MNSLRKWSCIQIRLMWNYTKCNTELPFIIHIVKGHPVGVPKENMEGGASDVMQCKPFVNGFHELHSWQTILKPSNITHATELLEIPEHRSFQR